MAKQSSSSKKSVRSGVFSGWLRRVGYRNAVIASVFLLAFGGLGSFYLFKSYAYSGCVYGHYTVGSSGRCVADIEQMLHNAGRDNQFGQYPGFSDRALGYYTGTTFHPDGVFGYGVKQQVIDFQRYNSGIGYSGGDVGYYTMTVLCGLNKYHPWVFKDAGCSPFSY